VKFYVMIGITLAIITAVEVAVYYIRAMEVVETPLILILTLGKFLLVVMFFMHLWGPSPPRAGKGSRRPRRDLQKGTIRAQPRGVTQLNTDPEDDDVIPVQEIAPSGRHPHVDQRDRGRRVR
jgi:hypothetical protein